MPHNHTHMQAPHIEPPLEAYQALVKDIHGDLETVTSFASSAAGASQIVQFFMPNRMLVQLTRLPGATFGDDSSTPFSMPENDCYDPYGGAMLKLAYVAEEQD